MPRQEQRRALEAETKPWTIPEVWLEVQAARGLDAEQATGSDSEKATLLDADMASWLDAVPARLVAATD